MSGVPRIESSVQTFLYDAYGYGKIRDFCRGKSLKPKDQSLKDFMADTIIGTYRTISINPEDPIDDLFEPTIPVTWPRVSQIRETTEGAYSYCISNKSWFKKMDFITVGEFLARRVRPLFQTATYDEKRGPTLKNKWCYQLQDPDFSLYISGSGRKNAKLTLVSFNLQPDIVADLQSICRQYRTVMNEITGIQLGQETRLSL